jgi:Spy/CpxP family protein refolding chaperone
MSDHHDVARGHRAARELELTEQAFDQLRQAVMEEWASSSSAHVDKREKLWATVNILDSVRQALMRMVDSGRIAEAAISAREALAGSDLLRP